MPPGAGLAVRVARRGDVYQAGGEGWGGRVGRERAESKSGSRGCYRSRGGPGRTVLMIVLPGRENSSPCLPGVLYTWGYINMVY